MKRITMYSFVIITGNRKFRNGISGNRMKQIL